MATSKLSVNTDVERPKRAYVKLQNNKQLGRIRFNEDFEEV